MAQVSETEQLIFEIAQTEWELFQNVQNTGGRASCQNDPDTFFKMRMSQWMVYSKETLESYMDDLKSSMAQGRNLIFEKYGFMMETTYPEEFEEIKGHLPKVSSDSQKMIDEMAKIHVKWDKEFYEKYPNIRKEGRVFKSSEDSAYNGSSSESYLKGEYKTYSPKTVKLIYEQVKQAEAAGENLLERIIENEVKFYGYQSLEDAEKSRA